MNPSLTGARANTALRSHVSCAPAGTHLQFTVSSVALNRFPVVAFLTSQPRFAGRAALACALALAPPNAAPSTSICPRGPTSRQYQACGGGEPL